MYMALNTNYKGYTFESADFDAFFRKHVINQITTSGDVLGIEVTFDNISIITNRKNSKVFDIPSMTILTAFYVDNIINMNDFNKITSITNSEYVVYFDFINKAWS
jgi:hypothetical protein